MNNKQRFSGEWETKRLGEIASIRNQKVMPENVNPNTLCVELEHISSGNGQLLENSTAEYSTASKYRFFAGDVLFGRLRSYLRKYWLADRDGICTTEIWPLIVDAKQVDNTFLHAIVQTDQFFEMANISYGTHMPRADWTVMRNFTVTLPPLSEQRAIAEVLSDVDGLINALDALIAKKRAIKQATMQQLLTGKTRLPGFSGEWETKQLGKIASFFKGSSLFTKSDMSLDGKRRCIHYGELFTTYGEYISEVLHGTDREESFFLSVSNDVLMPASDVTPNGLATASCISDSGVILGGDILVIRVPAEILNGVFLAHAIKINRNQVMQLVTGTTVYHLYGRDMANFTFDLPSIQEQNAIVRVLSDMDAEITALEQRRDKTIAIKQGMMQQLLTGRVRLSESRIIADDTDERGF